MLIGFVTKTNTTLTVSMKKRFGQKILGWVGWGGGFMGFWVAPPALPLGGDPRSPLRKPPTFIRENGLMVR